MLATHTGETDLLVPLPAEGETWDPHTIHTHYFGLTVPEAEIGAFVYLRWMPYFPLCQGGANIFQGMNNVQTTDLAHHDYEMTMPWPEIDGNRFTTANGLSIAFTEPGRRAEISYESVDGKASFDVVAEAVSPLAARGHVIPGEELHRVTESGGSEQFMHYTGTLELHGERHEVDCVFPRDRSWRQVRNERRDANVHPPVSWTPIYFSENLAFNQAGFEAPETNPDWTDVYDIPDGTKTHHFAWVLRGGELRDIQSVRLEVTDRDPATFAPRAMTIEADDEAGERYRFTGEAIALAPIVMWPNITSFDSVFRWEHEGESAYGTVQTMQSEDFCHAMKGERPAPSAPASRQASLTACGSVHSGRTQWQV